MRIVGANSIIKYIVIYLERVCLLIIQIKLFIFEQFKWFLHIWTIYVKLD